jgi:hypothetical protein
MREIRESHRDSSRTLSEMKTSFSVDEYDLLGFFEVTPTPIDRDISWAYNDSAYEVSRNGVHLIFVVTPVSRDVRIKLKVGERLIYELNATGIHDVKHHREKGRESLELILAPQDSLWIRLNPEISINHSMAEQL